MKPLRFIPFRKTDILSMCLIQGDLNTDLHQKFKQVHFLIQSILHFEFHTRLELIKDSYAEFDPDADTRTIDLNKSQDGLLIEQLEDILNKANYEKISQADLQQSLNEASLFKIRLSVEFDDFLEVLLYCRGEKVKSETQKKWFGLTSKTLSYTNYDRVVIFLKQKDGKSDFIPDNSGSSGSIFLKLFRNVPKADLEMLFPNTKIKMRIIDKLFIGVPAILSGGVIIATKLGATLLLLGSLIGYWIGFSAIEIELDKTKLLILLAGFGTLAAYLWKQFSIFKNKKLRFMKTLTENLYFKNLDNNAGVFHRLIDDAEEEEYKEIILAYYFLLISEPALTQKQLDLNIEQWFKLQWQCDVDFEIDDALKKLQDYKLVNFQNEKYSAVPIEQAVKILDQYWDDYFIPETQ